MILALTSTAAPLLLPVQAAVPIVPVVPADLSRPGWRWDPHQPGAGQLVTSAGPVPLRAVTGVLSCLTAVTPADLPHVAPADQGYVATEMTAFLAGWLHALPCPVLNPPVADCLAGAGLQRVDWLNAADRLGMPAAPRLPAALAGPTVRVGVVGPSVRSADATAGVSARRLAGELGVPLCAPVFATGGPEPVLLDVAPWWRAPEVDVAAAVDLLLDAGPRG